MDGKVTVITVPSAAKGLVPTGIPTITSIRTTGPGRINLTWKAAAGASAYQIYRSTSPTGGFAHIRNTTALTFTDVNLRPGITYYYKLRAFRRVYTTNFYGSESAVRYLRLLK